MSTKLDKDQVIKNVYNEMASSLNVTLIPGSSATTTPSKLDAAQIIKLVYDETTQTLRIINK